MTSPAPRLAKRKREGKREAGKERKREEKIEENKNTCDSSKARGHRRGKMVTIPPTRLPNF